MAAEEPLKKWYAVYTRSRHEKLVAEAYVLREVEFYLPLVTREQHWNDRRAMVDFPLFPGYLFVHEDFREHTWDKKMRLLEVKGVVRILCDHHGIPSQISDQEVFNIRTVLEKKMKVDPYRYVFYEGQPLRIRKGPLTGVEGHVMRRKGVHELVLQVHLLHQAVVVTLSAADVEAMG